MKYNISIAKDISNLCNTCLSYIILFITVLTIYEDGIPTPLWLLGIPFILICYQFIQNYCFHPILYILLHGIFWVPVYMIPFSYVEYRYLFFTLLFFEGANAIQIWRTNASKPYDEVPWQLLLCVSIIYAVANAYHLNQFALLTYYLGLAVLLLHFIRLFITGLTKLMTKSEQATSMPAKKIILTDALIFTFFLILLIVLVIWVQHSNVDQFFAALGQLLVKVIRFIIRTISYIATIISALFAKNRKMQAEEAQENVAAAWEELQEPSLLAKILDGIIMIAVIFILVYFVYRIIVALIKIFTKRYTQDTDIVVHLSKPREITKLPRENASLLQRVQELFKNDNASKIRRGYRLKVTSYKPAIFKSNDTPTDIATRIYDTYNEDVEELTEVYKKARYSNEEITFDDVQKGGLL